MPSVQLGTLVTSMGCAEVSIPTSILDSILSIVIMLSQMMMNALMEVQSATRAPTVKTRQENISARVRSSLWQPYLTVTDFFVQPAMFLACPVAMALGSKVVWLVKRVTS